MYLLISTRSYNPPQMMELMARQTGQTKTVDRGGLEAGTGGVG